MKMSAVDIRVGNILKHNNKLWCVAKTMHTQPGKGGAYMQVEMKDIIEGTKQNIRFRSDETVEKVRLDEKTYQFLYANGNQLELMDNETYEQISISSDLIPEEQLPLLKEGMELQLEIYEEKPVAVSLPETLVVEIEDCEPVIKGQTATSSYKPATVCGEVRIMVPQFINQGDKIIIKTETMEYMERAKNVS